VALSNFPAKKLDYLRRKCYFRTKLHKTDIMEVEGKIIAVGQSRGGVSKAGNNWKLQEYVLETIEQYPKKVAFEVFGEEKIQQFNIQVGESLKVSFDIDARQWQDRWFNSIRAWKVERVSADAPASAAPVQPAAQFQQPPFAAAPAPAPTDFARTDPADDLPF